ncbi:MAG: DNA starvation/stationary phase protection protein [Flavisolibacter sp.]|jgi:starvation-inducible DNA-binding protein|nr:DNA starvation/stationary phase protection protein [Flavisolibacter sp.]
MSKQSLIGLDTAGSQALAERLNKLLALYQVFYINARGFHWNIKGEKFFELHAKFEEIYNDLLVKVDEVAERILTLGHTPVHNFSEYLKLSAITETKDISDGMEAMKNVLISFRTLIQLQREIGAVASEVGDEGTNALMSDYIREQEKHVWMYTSYLA